MITDARVLQPEFVPQEVKHRDNEVNYLSSILEPVTDGSRIDPTLLYGPSGVGKTCIAQFLTEELRRNVVDLNTQYVNCWEDYTRFKTLYQLLNGIGETVDIHRQSTPRDVLLDRLRAYDGPPYVVILDEVDQLQDKDLLYDLYRIPTLSLILIANREEELFTPLDDRLQSRLRNANRIHFTAYSNDELVSILHDRVQWGLAENTIRDAELRQIADRAAGDARVAIGILRKAARTAASQGADRIHSELVADAVSEAKLEIERKTLDRLTPHQKVLYEIVTEAGEIDPSALYTAYQDRVDDPKSERTVRNYLSKLEHYNLIVTDGNTKARTYRAIR
ncbi:MULTISPECIES: Cdc6/Cdc18 family protein [Halobacterium]|uniref:Cdc6/Cdc18 family protein n=1 Tax=Halobacterium TaxID=2239 RepID=UPI001E2B0DC7|nr:MULTISPECIES: Cdc6/Cdc18 family protein [Halobacterium]MDL0138983.1 orc1/cdc6 family replication initiation protein [Halobacterium salinarum]UHH27228.1 orc1/cdc6 family replication initiation protein [Halobacterium noricense]